MKLYVVSKIGFSQHKKRLSSRSWDFTWGDSIYDESAQVLIVAKEKSQAEAFFSLQEAEPFYYDRYAKAEWRRGEEIFLEEFEINPKNKLPGKLIASALLGNKDAVNALREACNDFNLIDCKISQDKEKPADEDDSDC